MARALAFLFASGGTLVFLTLLLPHAANADETGLAVLPTLAYVAAVGLVATQGRLGVPPLQVTLAFGSVLIAGCVVFGGDAGSAYPVLFFWVSLYAYWFFTIRAAAAEIVWAAVLLAVAFALRDDTPVPGIHWTMLVGSLAVGGILTAVLTRAVRAQAADLAAVSQVAGDPNLDEAIADATVNGLAAAVRADVVAMLEPDDDGRLHVVARAASTEDASGLLDDARVRRLLDQARQTGRAVLLTAEGPTRGLRALEGRVLGVAEPIIAEGRVVAVLVLGYASARRALSERVRAAARLFAGEAALALERAAVRDRDRQKQALELNDAVVQGLVVTKYLLQRGDEAEAVMSLNDTLDRARKLITDELATVSGGRLRPGDLRRSGPSPVTTVVRERARRPPAEPPPPPSAG